MNTVFLGAPPVSDSPRVRMACMIWRHEIACATRRYKEGVASFIERRTPQFENYNSTRPLIQKANEYFEPRGANLLGKL
jgi:hypothetical protein